MGNFLNNRIAKVDEPKQISLANNPNFVTFSSKGDRKQDKPMKIKIRMKQLSGSIKPNISLTFTDVGGNKYLFKGVFDKDDLADNSFLLIYTEEDEDKEESILVSLYNLRDCLLKNTFIKNNFDVDVPFQTLDAETGFASADTIELTSKGAGEQYDVAVACFYEPAKDKPSESDPDMSIGLNDIDYSAVDINTLYFKWDISYDKPGENGLRPAVFALVRASFENNEDEFFQIVKPEKGVLTYKQAKLATLKNLKACMERQYPISATANIHFNKKDLRLECFLIKKYPYFDRISSKNPLFDIYEKKAIPVPRSLIRWYYMFDIDQTLSYASDTIDAGNGNHQIVLDVYTDTNRLLGSDNKQKSNTGTYLATLSKSYFGKPLWFETNTLMSKRSKYSPLFLTELEKSATWIDAGTIADYYFVAKRYDGTSTTPFYISDTLYAINGYDYTLNDCRLNNYVLDLSQDFDTGKYDKIEPLTTHLNRTHIKGQKQYFNFILKNAVSKQDLSSYNIALQYKLFTQSGVPVGEHIDQKTDSSEFGIVNTALLRLDQFLPKYNGKTVGRIDVCLTLLRKSQNEEGIDYPALILSEPLSFRILPQLLHKVNDFAFLNRLGGWDSFNFGGSISSEFKSAASTIYKTLEPGFDRQSEIESISSRTVQEQTLMQTSPINAEVVDWLREMAASASVYELNSKRYVIIDDMTLKNNSEDDLFQVEMKYHYSDTYNGRIK